MGLFDKKYCDICGEKIGLLGNRKLEDGNCCKDCAAKLSPWMTDRRTSTIAEIKQHLAYREANRDEVARIHPTKVLGNNTKVYIDETQNKFFVTRIPTGRTAIPISSRCLPSLPAAWRWRSTRSSSTCKMIKANACPLIHPDISTPMNLLSPSWSICPGSMRSALN